MMKKARSFEHGAEDYERLRPEFPTQLFDDIRAAAGTRLDGRVLEIGAGTGRATLPLARDGAKIEVVEPSEDMLGILAGRLEAEALGDQCDLRQATFEQVDPAQVYDVIIAAQSFHWADPATRWPRLSSLLRTDGRAYLFWNGWHLAAQTHNVGAVLALYDDCGHGLQPDLEDHRADVRWADSEIEAEPTLDLVDARTYEWPWRLPVDDYLTLLMTTSQYSVAAASVRDPLMKSLRQLLGDQVTLNGKTRLLQVATNDGLDKSSTR